MFAKPHALLSPQASIVTVIQLVNDAVDTIENEGIPLNSLLFTFFSSSSAAAVRHCETGGGVGGLVSIKPYSSAL